MRVGGTGHTQMGNSDNFIFRGRVLNLENQTDTGRATWNTVYNYKSMFINRFIATGLRCIYISFIYLEKQH